MAFFTKTDPAAKSQRDLETKLKAKRASRDDLAERLKAAEAGAASFREKAIKLASDGSDDTALSAAEIAMRREQDRAATLTDAIAKTDIAIADLEREIANLVDQRCRAETTAAIDTLVEKWSSTIAAFDAAIGPLVEVARESATIVLDANPLRAFLEAVQQQIGPEAKAVTSVLEGHAKAVLAGTAPASLPKPWVPDPAKVVERPVTERMFAMRTVRWRDVHGTQQIADQYTHADLTPAAAKNGRACGAVIDVSDPRCAKLHGAHGGRHPSLEYALDLDGPGDNSVARYVPTNSTNDVIAQARFTLLDRGPERTLRTAGPLL
jgi:hypothetical protein